MQIPSKLPDVGTTIFTLMSALANECGAINLSQGFPDYSSAPRLIELVHQYMAKGYNQYAPMAGVPALLQRLSEKICNLYQCAVDAKEEITVTAGATQAIFTAITAFVHPGDEVILIEPAYDSYRPSVEVCGGIPVPYQMSAPAYTVKWNELESLISPKTRMIIINSPHNPTGTTLKPSDLKELQRITSGTDIIILSDEVYEHLIYDRRSHQSIFLYPELFRRSLITFSFGKTFHNTGWKVGYCVAPGPLMKEFRKVHQFNVFTVNTPVQYALADFLADPEEYLKLPEFYQQKRDLFLGNLSGSRLRPLRCEGTYFCLFDYTAISKEPDVQFARRMATEFGVAAIPVSVFNSNGKDDRIIRLCFAKSDAVLEKAGELLRKI